MRTRRGCPGPPGGEGGATTSASSKTVAGSFLNAAAGSIVKTVASVLKLVKPAPISSTVTPIRKKMSTSCIQEASPPHKALRTPRIPLSANTNLWSPRRPNKCSRPDGAPRRPICHNQVKSSRAPLQVAYPSKTVLLSWLPEHIRATGLLFMDRLDTMSHDGPLQHTSDSAGAGARCWVTSNIRHPFELEFNLNWYSSRISIQSPTPRT